jgi:3-isopropylmalate dehydrogenase
MLLRYSFGQEAAAARLEAAVLRVLDDGLRTGDIMSPGKTAVGCARMGDALVRALEAVA